MTWFNDMLSSLRIWRKGHDYIVPVISSVGNGAKGEKGDKGDTFTYRDLSSEQIKQIGSAAIAVGAKGDKGDTGPIGPQGPKGDKGDPFQPTFANPIEWSSERQYDDMTIVYHDGDSYCSKSPVPIGTAISDTAYWVKVSDFNAQIEIVKNDSKTLLGWMLNDLIFDHIMDIPHCTFSLETITSIAEYYQPSDIPDYPWHSPIYVRLFDTDSIAFDAGFPFTPKRDVRVTYKNNENKMFIRTTSCPQGTDVIIDVTTLNLDGSMFISLWSKDELGWDQSLAGEEHDIYVWYDGMEHLAYDFRKQVDFTVQVVVPFMKGKYEKSLVYSDFDHGVASFQVNSNRERMFFLTVYKNGLRLSKSEYTVDESNNNRWSYTFTPTTAPTQNDEFLLVIN